MKHLNTEALAERISQRAENDIKENNICGASVAVLSHDKILYKAHFGTLSAEDETPVGDSTLFRLASMTKPITAVAVMILYDKGLIDLDDPVEKYLPEFKDRYIAEMVNGRAEKVRRVETVMTVKHLLTHTSGLLAGECGNYYANALTDEDNKTLKSTVDYYSTVGLSFEPFTNSEYSAVAAFDLLARIVEVVSGTDFAEFIKEHITDPCGMTDTVFTPSEEQWKRIIPLHTKEDGKSGILTLPEGCIFWSNPVTHYLGGAGLVSSLEDYSAFASMLLKMGRINGRRVLSEEAVRLMSTPHTPESIKPGKERWGLGMRVIASEDYHYLPVGAYGWSGSYGTHFWIDPVNSVAAVYMKNSRYDGGSGAVTALNFEKDVFNSFQ